MSTRFYLPAEGSGAPVVSPAFDSNWEQTGQATRLRLPFKTELNTLSTLANTGTRTVPITTTQDILCNQWVSDTIPAQRITGTISYVGRVLQTTTVGTTLAVSLRVVSQDGGTVRGTLYSIFGVDTAFASTAATRIRSAIALTPLTSLPGDRLVLEIGGRATAPAAAGTYTMRFGTSAVTDFALTTALTTDLNPWMELSQDIRTGDVNNFRNIQADSGISATELVRAWG